MENLDKSTRSWLYFFISAFVVIAAGVLKTVVMDRGWKPEGE